MFIAFDKCTQFPRLFPGNDGMHWNQPFAFPNENSHDPGKIIYQKMGKIKQSPTPFALGIYPPHFSTKCAY